MMQSLAFALRNPYGHRAFVGYDGVRLFSASNAGRRRRTPEPDAGASDAMALVISWISQGRAAARSNAHDLANKVAWPPERLSLENG